MVECLDFAAILPEANAIDAQHLEQLVLAVTASAAPASVCAIWKPCSITWRSTRAGTSNGAFFH
jgi:hypothetical protein